VAIVVGYKKEQIINHVMNRKASNLQRIHFIENQAFAITNNIYSLWLALEWLQNDSFIVLNADVIFDAEILDLAVRSDAPISMIIDPLWRDETMKVIIHGDRIIQMSKKISREQFSATYIGITVFSKSIQPKFFDKMATLISAGRVNDFFNMAVQELVDEGIQVGYTNTNGLAWAEIDDPTDLSFAQQNVFPQLVTAQA
jgi:choline kinase